MSNTEQVKVDTKTVHMIANAHLDPVWQWQWEDGFAEAVSTFRIACEFCETHDGFIFNHNESILYEFIEEHDPELFARIQALVRKGSWHISGGAYLQPDINMTSGESHIRQYLVGLQFFKEKFDSRPTTAYNFDSFGHADGFSQILAGCGFDSYIFTRPRANQLELPKEAFEWSDRSGNSVLARRSADGYQVFAQQIDSDLEKWIPYYDEEGESLMLWGLGNHGGGMTQSHYDALQKYADAHPEYDIVHSTPERYFEAIRDRADELPKLTGEFQNNHEGCATSMYTVKKVLRDCENLLTSVERLSALNWFFHDVPYPHAQLEDAWKKTLYLHFHDILPGSATQAVEWDSVATGHAALETLRQVRIKQFAKVIQKTSKAGQEQVPLFVWNPHGHAVETIVETEYQISHVFYKPHTIDIALHDEDGNAIPFQVEKEDANVGFDWRKKVAFPITLKPFELRRITASYTQRDEPEVPSYAQPDSLAFSTAAFDLTINPQTGLVDSWVPKCADASIVEPGCFAPLVYEDTDNSWQVGDAKTWCQREGHSQDSIAWKDAHGCFRLATPQEAGDFLLCRSEEFEDGKTTFDPVTVVENGAVRTIVQALFIYNRSVIVRNYIINHTPASFVIEDRVFWNEKYCMLKMQVPVCSAITNTLSESTYGVTDRKTDINFDRHNQRWVCALLEGGMALETYNDASYAHSFDEKNLYLNMIRSPAYCSFGLLSRIPRQTKGFQPRQDQGEHMISFAFGASAQFDETQVAQRSNLFSVPAECCVYYPGGNEGQNLVPAATEVTVDHPNVQICAVKKAEDSEDLVVRFYETSGSATDFTLTVGQHSAPLSIGGYALKTVLIKKDHSQLSLVETNLVEEPL